MMNNTMEFKQSGLLIVLSGPSGVGKGTLCKEVLKEYPNLKLSISVTTRMPRPFEVEGKHYFFRTKEEFLQLIQNDMLIEYAKVFDSNYYGTPRHYVEEEIGKGNDVVLEIDVNGALQVKKNFPQAILVFIAPPSFDELEKRLVNRGTEDEEKIKRRLGAATHELLEIEKYDYVVINDWINQAKRKIINIITAEKCRIKNNKEFIYKITGRN
jgi:guanylate kinase